MSTLFWLANYRAIKWMTGNLPLENRLFRTHRHITAMSYLKPAKLCRITAWWQELSQVLAPLETSLGARVAGGWTSCWGTLSQGLALTLLFLMYFHLRLHSSLISTSLFKMCYFWRVYMGPGLRTQPPTQTPAHSCPEIRMEKWKQT